MQLYWWYNFPKQYLAVDQSKHIVIQGGCVLYL